MSALAVPDWREPADYAGLAGLDRGGWAWEWLRRSGAYREAAGESAAQAGPDPAAARFGLLRFEDPGRGAGEARIFWTALASAFVIDAVGDPSDMLGQMSRSMRISVVDDGAAKAHLLVMDERSALRIDVAPAAARSARSGLVLRVADLGRLPAQIASLTRLNCLLRTGRLPASPLSRARTARLRRLLRVRDALASGADQRAIAEVLLDADVAAPRWRLEHPTVRLQVQRLVRQTRAMAGGGFRALLSSLD